jgi:hypothetical protein
MQNEIKKSIPLLDNRGHLTEEGYAKLPYWEYSRNEINVSKYKIKEWDYFYIYCPDNNVFLTFTVSDLGYAGLYAAAVIDLSTGKFAQTDEVKLLTKHRTNLAPSADEDHQVEVSGKNLSIQLNKEGSKRSILFSAPELEINGSKGFSGNIVITEPAEMERMVIATSWEENRKAFYYNQKINCMHAAGLYKLGDKHYTFSEKSMAGLDWGRGVWTRKNRWYWGSASVLLDGVPFGFNIGYGFSDRTPASENMIFYNGKAHKIEDIEFIIDTDNYLNEWEFVTSDGRLDMKFRPAVDRFSNFNVKLIQSIQHQVFGYFTGKAILDDGKEIEFADLPGFAEDVYNKW